MNQSSLHDKLNAALYSYDYGIVPGSATVYLRDYSRNMGRLDLTLLEGVMVVIEVDSTGYMVLSCSPLSTDGLAVTTAQAMQIHMNTPFESMESLLMTISPMFCERFQTVLFEKLGAMDHGGEPQLEAQSTAVSSVPQSTAHPTDHHKAQTDILLTPQQQPPNDNIQDMMSLLYKR